jgi:hypothetical protein
VEEILNKVDTSGLFARYPHLAKKITSLWGSAEGREFLVSLMSDSRSDSRAGFSHDDAKTVFMLLNRHDALYPYFDRTVEVGASIGSRVARRPIKKRDDSGSGLMRYIYPFLALIAFAVLFKAYQLFF